MQLARALAATHGRGAMHRDAIAGWLMCCAATALPRPASRSPSTGFADNPAALFHALATRAIAAATVLTATLPIS